jgi:hypothetical protein
MKIGMNNMPLDFIKILAFLALHNGSILKGACLKFEVEHIKMAVFWVVEQCGLVEVYRRFKGALIIREMSKIEAASTSETSVNVYETALRNNPEESHLHTHSLENLKYHFVNLYGGGTHRS